MALRNYSNTAVETSLTVGIDDTAGSITVGSVSGYPDAPFTITIDPDTEFEEACLVTLVSGLSLNVTRGIDGTAALPHVSGAVVKHAAIAADFREANEHVHETEYVHGTTSDVVGVSDAQTLSNKNISGLVNNITDIPMDSVAGLDDALDLKADLAGATFTGPVNLPAATTIGDVDATEISHLDGVTAPIQTQIDDLNTEVDTKAPLNSPTFTGTVVLPTSTSIGGVSAGEISALDGVRSNVQGQIDALTGGEFFALPPGGETGQVLTKLSNADFHVAWQTLTIIGNGAASDAIYPANVFSGGTRTEYTDPISGYVYEVRTLDYTTGSTTSVTNTVGVIGKLLVVAGGGGGGLRSGSRCGGGGGGGGVFYGDYAFGAGQHNLLVGAGGGAGAPGQNSTFDDIICYGGGNGGNSSGAAGAAGGSGGGGHGNGGTGGAATKGTGAASENFYGNPGGTGDYQNGGGGGSANLTCDITGVNVTYGAGGAGGVYPYGPAGNPGVDGLGSGGTGGVPSLAQAGPGGHGRIIIRYRIA